MDIQNANGNVKRSTDLAMNDSENTTAFRPRRPFLRPLRHPKQCVFCVDSSKKIDFKNPSHLYRFISDRSKILSRRITGLCAYHQRRVAKNIKIARFLSLVK